MLPVGLKEGRRDWLHCELGHAVLMHAEELQDRQIPCRVLCLNHLCLALSPSPEERWASPPALRSPLDLIFLGNINTIFQIISYCEMCLNVSDGRCNSNISLEHNGDANLLTIILYSNQSYFRSIMLFLQSHPESLQSPCFQKTPTQI